MRERGINLRGFKMELEDNYGTVRGAGPVLIVLMSERSVWHDMKLAKYFAARGKLTKLDARYVEWTALTYASSEGHLDILKALIAAGANKDKVDGYGYTPLTVAALYGHVVCLKVLLTAGADKDKADSNGNTPLIFAANNGHVECAKALLAVKIDVNKADEDGANPLICASRNGYVEIVKLLLAAGAKKDKITSGETALTYAIREGHHEIVQLLQQAK